MQPALGELPEELRGVVFLRVFEELPMAEVATRLGIGLSAAKHRFRKGIEVYRRLLRAAFAGTSSDGR
jgi:DNA-directed RNA polymerase specialized sigma24 family protein